MNLNIEGTFGWPFCTNFAVDEALGRIEENMLGGTKHQGKNKTRYGNLCRVVLPTRVKLEVRHADLNRQKIQQYRFKGRRRSLCK